MVLTAFKYCVSCQVYDDVLCYQGNAARQVETTEAMFVTYRSKLHCASTHARKLQELNNQCSVELQARLSDLSKSTSVSRRVIISSE